MHRRFVLALAFVASCAATALACGPRTVALIEAAAAAEAMKPPLFRCGPMFNEMLVRAHKKDWKGALEAYEAHLRGRASTADEREALDFLQRKAESQKGP